jgi:hypothetical protein
LSIEYVVKVQKPPAMRDRRSRRVTERNTSLHSGSIDSVQNPEAELRDFEAQWQKAEIFAFGKFCISSRLCADPVVFRRKMEA